MLWIFALNAEQLMVNISGKDFPRIISTDTAKSAAMKPTIRKLQNKWFENGTMESTTRQLISFNKRGKYQAL